MDPRVNQGVTVLDAFKTASHQGFSAQIASGNLGRCFDGGQAMRFACHGKFSVRVQTGTILQTPSPVHAGASDRYGTQAEIHPAA
jgi:hypothetical protein